MAFQKRPMVSCLMVTHDRLEMALESVRCFQYQTYDPLELVVIADGLEHGRRLAGHSLLLQDSRIRVVSFPSRTHSLGALRNISIDHATGDLICQWDDDDLYHPDRVAAQVSRLLEAGADACFLTDQLLLFRDTGDLYWCDWSHARISGWLTAVPNTVVCRRSLDARYPEVGPNSERSEDRSFLEALEEKYAVATLRSMGFLYIYVTHGDNTWPTRHFMRLVRSTGLDSSGLLEVRRELTTQLARYRGSRTVVVRNHEGVGVYSLALGGENNEGLTVDAGTAD